MGIMSEIDIMRQEGAKTPEDFEAHGYDRETSEAMASIVKHADAGTLAAQSLATGENRCECGRFKSTQHLGRDGCIPPSPECLWCRYPKGLGLPMDSS